MTPVLRVKFGLLAMASLFAAAVAWNAAQGQFRPPVIRPPIGPRPVNPPGMNPGGFPRTGPTIVKVWTCSGCGKELGRGLSAPPDRCPHCGARIINGVGNGVRQPNMGGGFVPPNPTPPANPPGMVPNPPPGTNPNPNLPVMNPNPPAFNPNPPVVNPMTNDTGPANPSANESSSSISSSGGLSKGKIAAIVIGIIVVGLFVLVGGTWLMIYTMRSSEPQSRRRRRRRNEDHDD